MVTFRWLALCLAMVALAVPAWAQWSGGSMGGSRWGSGAPAASRPRPSAPPRLSAPARRPSERSTGGVPRFVRRAVLRAAWRAASRPDQAEPAPRPIVRARPLAVGAPWPAPSMTPIEVEEDDRPTHPRPAADCGVGAAPAGAGGAIVVLAALAALAHRRHSTRRTSPT